MSSTQPDRGRSAGVAMYIPAQPHTYTHGHRHTCSAQPHTYTHSHGRTRTATYIHARPRTYPHGHVHTRTATDIHARPRTYMHSHVHTDTAGAAVILSTGTPMPHTYLHSHLHTHTATYIHAQPHAYTHGHLHTHMAMYIHTQPHTYMHSHVLTCTATYIHTQPHTYTHSHVLTCTATYIHTRPRTYTHGHGHTRTAMHMPAQPHTHTHSHVHTRTVMYIHAQPWTYTHGRRHTHTATCGEAVPPGALLLRCSLKKVKKAVVAATTQFAAAVQPGSQWGSWPGVRLPGAAAGHAASLVPTAAGAWSWGSRSWGPAAAAAAAVVAAAAAAVVSFLMHTALSPAQLELPKVLAGVSHQPAACSTHVEFSTPHTQSDQEVRMFLVWVPCVTYQAWLLLPKGRTSHMQHRQCFTQPCVGPDHPLDRPLAI